MRALARTDNGLTYTTDWPEPTVQQGQALLKIKRAGICNTDLELVQGYLDFKGVLGHEFSAEVVSGAPEWVGARVVAEINVACHTCDLCREGVPSQCRHRRTVGIRQHDGGFADRLAVNTSVLHRIPDSVSDDQAVFVEPLAAAFQILEATHISPRDEVILIGAGKLGLLCAQVLALTGARVRAVVRRERPAKLLDSWGIKPMALADLPANRANVVVDCTGSADGFASALGLLRPRGTLVLKSTYHGIPQADLSRVVVDEIKVVGSRCGPFEAALRALEAGHIDTASLIDARYPLDDALTAMQAAAKPGALKVLLDVG
ncbi:MAG: alcohol dehydrogenase catalytic domain-containing protein [Anaerolineae bacterium]|jgi:threonine dehydrogenase-like Zn-dependent dehydrogenase|nr:alcohol dehydrogenase catalytic domain-containing protein [Anaerolineae bacterium]